MTESEDKSKDDADRASSGGDASAAADSPAPAGGAAPAANPIAASASAGAPGGGPEDRVAALEKEKAETRDRMLRIAADFENYKKRARKDQTEAEQKAREQVLRDMLEVVDNLDRATTAFGDVADAASVLRGVALVLRLFQSKLERYEVKAIEAKGQPFDPRLHEAISQVPTADQAPGTVVSEMQKGYKIGDRLLRAAVVAVATAPKTEASPDEPKVEVEVDDGKAGGIGGVSGKGDA